MEVEHYVHEKHHVHHTVHNQKRKLVHSLDFKSRIVGNHDGGVERECKDNPVPDGFEEAVVEDDVGRGFGRLQAVLRQHVRVQVHHLKRKFERCEQEEEMFF